MKSIFVRNLCLLLVLVMTVGLFAACGGGEEPVEPSATVEASQEPDVTDPTKKPDDGGKATANPTQKPSSGATQAPDVKPTSGTTAKPTSTPVDNSYGGQRKSAQIGIWYAVWYDSTADGSFWDTSGRKSSTYPGDPIYYRPLLPDGTYGKYRSSDNAVINFHLQQISDAQIDFIIMDQTNNIDNGTLNAVSIKVAKAIHAWNKESGNRQLRYCSGIGAYATKDNMEHIESEAKKLYERYISKDWGTSKDHVYVDGKPLLIIYNDYFTESEWKAYQKSHSTPYCDRFTIRFAKGHVRNGQKGYWGWVMPEGPQINEDVAVMMPGWYKIRREGEGFGGANLPYVYRNRGKFYEDGWKKLLKSDIVPDFVVINSFNEYAEHTGVFTAKTDLFPSNYGIERWLDSSGKEKPSLYWDLTKTYIAKFKKGDRA